MLCSFPIFTMINGAYSSCGKTFYMVKKSTSILKQSRAINILTGSILHTYYARQVPKKQWKSSYDCPIICSTFSWRVSSHCYYLHELESRIISYKKQKMHDFAVKSEDREVNIFFLKNNSVQFSSKEALSKNCDSRSELAEKIFIHLRNKSRHTYMITFLCVCGNKLQDCRKNA